MEVQEGAARRADHPLVPYLLIVVAPVIWGFSGVLVRWAGLPGREYIIIFWRSTFAVAFFMVVILLVRDFGLLKPGSGLLLLVTSGVVTGLFTICAFKAYNIVPIGVATFIMYLAPVFVALLAPVFLKEKLLPSTLLCLGIALGGTALLSFGKAGGGGQLKVEGILLGLGAAATWALLMLIWKKLRETHSPVTIGLWTNLVCAVIYAPFAVGKTGLITPKGWASLSVFGVVSIGAASLTYLYALKKVKAQDAGLLSYIEPVSAVVMGFIFLSESLSWQEYVGAALIFVAGVILILYRRGAAAAPDVFDAAER